MDKNTVRKQTSEEADEVDRPLAEIRSTFAGRPDELIPMLQVGAGETLPDPEEIRGRLDRELNNVADRLLDWSPAELQFFDRLHDEGVIDAAALTGDPGLEVRVRKQQMLLWKAQNVRNFRGRTKSRL